MSFDTSDPRSTMDGAGHGPAGVNVSPQFFELDRIPPSETTATGGSHRWVRSQAMVVDHVELAPGERVVSGPRPDEHVILVPDPATRLELAAGAQAVTARGPAVVVMPPGETVVEAETSGSVVRLFAAATSPELCARAANAAFYATPDPNVAPYRPWPPPTDGHRIRVYAVDEVEPAPGRFGRIFRCSTFMVNWLYPEDGPRDTSRLSPHHHDDFEQLSLQLAGDYVHHIRTPWTVDMARWRDDVHRQCASPSLTVIPPPAVHTSRAVGEGVHQLVDIFCPPRVDFSEKDGWVLNAAEYPQPDG